MYEFESFPDQQTAVERQDRRATFVLHELKEQIAWRRSSKADPAVMGKG